MLAFSPSQTNIRAPRATIHHLEIYPAQSYTLLQTTPTDCPTFTAFEFHSSARLSIPGWARLFSLSKTQTVRRSVDNLGAKIYSPRRSARIWSKVAHFLKMGAPLVQGRRFFQDLGALGPKVHFLRRSGGPWSKGAPFQKIPRIPRTFGEVPKPPEQLGCGLKMAIFRKI